MDDTIRFWAKKKQEKLRHRLATVFCLSTSVQLHVVAVWASTRLF